MSLRKRFYMFSKKIIASWVIFSTVLWSVGLPVILPVQTAEAAAPKISLVQYINPTTFQVKFDQAMNLNTIVAGSFTLSTGATDDTAISAVSSVFDGVYTIATVTANGAKISPSFSDLVKVASGSETNAPKNTVGAGEPNSDGNNIGLIMSQGQVVISEIKLSGSAATDEFIEIYNRTNSTVDLTDWKLTALNQGGTPTDLVTFTGASSATMQGKLSIPAGGYRLIGPTGTASADATYTATGNGIDTDNTIILYRPIDAIFRAEDIVGCGTAAIRENNTGACPTANGSLERKASPSSTAATMNASATPVGSEAIWGNGNDSNNNSFDFVIQSGTGVNPQSSTSAVEVTGGGQYQNQSPNINHMPISQVISGQDMQVDAMIADPETPPVSIIAQLIYSTDNWVTPTTVTGTYVAGSPFKFIIPSAATGSGTGTAFKYYLKANDGNGGITCMSFAGTGSCGASDINAKNGSWTVASISNTGWNNTIKGQVKDSVTATGQNNVMVTLRGNGLTFSTTTTADGATAGAFTFSNLPPGIFRVEASSPGFLDGWLDGVPSKTTGAAYTDWVLNLTAGSGGGGQGGDINTPRVMWSAPMEGMMSAPTKINIPATGMPEAPILLGFSKDMDSTTIIADNIKIYPVTSSGLGTALTGVSVAYQPQNSSVTLTDRSNRVIGATDFGPDKKAILYSATPLSANSQYAVVISAGVKDSAGNALQGNNPAGGHNINFSTGGDFSSMNTTQMQTNFTSFMSTSGGGGQFTPPYVTGSTPQPGSKNVPTNAKIVVNFSQPMDSTGINATNSVGTYVKVYDTNYNNTGSGQYITLESISLDNTTKQSATITIGGSGFTASHNYAIRVLGGAKSSGGITMAMPGQEQSTMYQADFTTGTGADIGAPTVLGTTLQTYTSTAPCSSGIDVCVTGVPTNVGVIEVSFSKDIDLSTISTSNITLKNGTTTVTTTVQYDPMARSVRIAPSSILYTVTNYTLTVGTGVKAMNGTALTASYVASFTTSSNVDTAPPSVQLANADDYKLAVTFSEPMQAAKATDANNWGASVLNPTNYVLYTDNGPAGVGSTAKYFNNNNLSSATTTETGGPLNFKYDAVYNTVVIEGLKLMAGVVKGGFRVWVKNVKDLSGNIITDTDKPATAEDFGANSAGGPVNNSKDTFGMIGPGGGGMSGPPPTAMLSGGPMTVTAFGGKDPGMMGFKPIGVWPVNMLGGQESLYMIDMPLTQAIPVSGQIVLTFPVGFDVTNATDADPNKLWAHKDINGPGTGTVVLSGISANASARTITITLGAVATQANDFLHLEIDRIKNTTAANDADVTSGVSMGSGYQVDIYTKTPSSGGSRTLETLKSMPFFIKKAGSSTLTGSITFRNVADTSTVDVDNTSVPVFLMSPMTGPLKTTVSITDGTGTYTFSNIPTGIFMFGTDPLVTIGDTDYYVTLSPMPQQIEITSGSKTQNLTFQAQDNSAKPQVTVYITGTFSNEKLDIFAGGPQGFSVKTVTLNGTFTNASPSTQTIYLPNTGTWTVGMGPAMPRGPQQTGPPPMPNWMPPKPVNVTVSGTGPGWTWQDEDGAATGDTSATDGKITIGVTSANKTINGHVYNPAGTTGIQNVEIFAYSPAGGMNSRATTGPDGSFSLKVIEGSYKVGAFLPGMPPSQEIPVEVKTVNSVTAIYANGVATTDVIIKINNPESMYTISGKVTDGTNVIKDASVYARKTDGPGNIGTRTDSMGKYILYVPAGVWTVGVFLPQYGNLAEQTVTVTTASQANIDFAPTVGTTFYTVKDRVYKDATNNGSYDAGTDTLLSSVHVDFSNATYRNTAISQAGIYSIKVPAGTYTVTGWSPTVGKIPSQTVVVSADINTTGAADLPVPDTKTITVNFKDANGNAVTVDEVYAQMDKIGTANVSNEANRKKVSSLTFDVPSGTNYQYALDIDIPGISDTALTVSSPTDGVVTANDIDGDSTTDVYQVKVENNLTLNVTVPTLYAVSGAAQDNSGNPLANSVINIKKAGSDIALKAKTDASGNYSVSLPASGSSPYLFQIDKAGYIDTSISVPVTGTTTQNLDGVKSTLTISGQVKIGSSGAENSKVYAKELGGGFASTETDTQGNYTLSVAAGNWKISATSDYYQEANYQNSSSQQIVLPMVAAPKTGIDITLATQKTGLAGLNNADLNPSSGATFEHSSANLEIYAPQNAIASSQATYQMEDKEVSNITSTPTSKTIGGKAVEINAYEPSGSSMVAKNDFDSNVTIEKRYTKAELTAEGINTFAKADKVKMSYFDESASNWEPTLTNITYLDSNDAPVIPTSNLSNVSAVIYAGVSDHMTVYSPTNQTPDGLAPAAPTSVTASAATSYITVSWTAPTTNADSTTLSDLLGYEIYRSTDPAGTYVQINTSDVTGTTYNDTGATVGTTYFYKVTAADTGGIESAMSSASSGATRTSGSSGSSSGGGGVISGDIFAPTISQIAVSASDTKATVTWKTGETSNTWVVYGETTAYGKETRITSTYLTSHSVVLTGLTPSTVYHYQVKSQDSVGNIGSYTDKTFTTLAAGQNAPATQPTTQPATTQQEIKIPTFTKPISQMTPAEIRAKVSEIMAVIVQLQAELARVQAAAISYVFNKTLKLGDRNDEIKSLQTVLKAEGVYPEAIISGYFGSLTKRAVAKFQEKYANEILKPYGLTKGTGIVGTATRAKLNSLMGK